MFWGFRENKERGMEIRVNMSLGRELPPLSTLYVNQFFSFFFSFFRSAKRHRYEFSATVLLKTCK